MADELRDARHLTFATLDSFWEAEHPIALDISGEPTCWLRIDPSATTLTLVTPYTADVDVDRLQNVSFAAFIRNGEELAELTVRVDNNLHGAYGLLSTIADKLQLEGLPLASAVADGVARQRELFENRLAFTTEQEIGLFGELLFLEFAIRACGVERALAAWQGPMSEEHDFTFAEAQVEVKTTLGERRKHVIHGLDQLVALRGSPLFLVSLQVTRGAPATGRSLPALVGSLRAQTGASRSSFESVLQKTGWRDEDADLYKTPWAVRSCPRAFRVVGDFPSMTAERVAPVVPNFPLISAVTYVIDVSDLVPDDLPGPLSGLDEVGVQGNGGAAG